jgi:glycosyltransferase involved in cell wall biosynthesis
VADGKGDSFKDGVFIYDVGLSHGRLNRIINGTRRVFDRAVQLNADVYHLHDPELLPVALKLRKKGKIVVFDAHEDVPNQLLAKPYLGPIRLRALSIAFSLYENYVCRRLSGIVAATPYIRDKFLKINPNTIDVNNYPLLGELDCNLTGDSKNCEICYVGGLGSIRGIRETIRAMELVKSDVRLNLAGNFVEQQLEKGVRAAVGWTKVNDFGYVDRVGVREIMARSIAGLVTLHPVINYLDALPVKMFEYMAAGIPPIASNFPLWRGILEADDCGICVDPLDPLAIARAIDHLVSNPQEAKRLGVNGRRAVVEKYNWGIEERKLLNFYKKTVACASN